MKLNINPDIVHSPIFECAKTTRFYFYLKIQQATQVDTYIIDTGTQYKNIDIYENEVVYDFEDTFIKDDDIEEITKKLYEYGVAVATDIDDFYIKYKLILGY